VLVEFARRLSRETREVDLVFRQGGEEFVALLPETDAAGAAVLAQRLGTAVRGEPVVIAQRHGIAVRGEPVIPPRGIAPPSTPGRPTQPSVQITVSIGIAVYPDHALTPRAVLDAADDALYAAKAAGRDTYRVATTAPVPVAASELPVRAGARSPEDDLPQAGGPAIDGGAPRPPHPPRQTRNG
jgi:GGDEF domain-containing protein